MKRNELNHIVTEKAAAYIAQGYDFNLSTMSWSGKHVDLRKGDELIRIYVKEDRPMLGNCIVETVSVITAHNTRPLLDNGWDCVHDDEMETLEEDKWVVCTNYTANHGRTEWLAPFEEADAIAAKKLQRLERDHAERECYQKELTSDATKAIVLKYLRRQPKMKSCKLDDIQRIYRNGSHICVEAKYKPFQLQ